MSADRRREILEELGRGDEIAVAERLKAEAVALAALLDDLPGDDRQLTAERVQELLAATSSASESFLTVALPVVEYGEGVALETLPRALRQVALATAAARTDQTARRVAAVPAIGGWSGRWSRSRFTATARQHSWPWRGPASAFPTTTMSSR